MQSRNIKRFAIIRNSSPWSITQVGFYRKAAEKLAVQITDEFESTQLENNDWRTILPKLRAKDPDAIVLFLGKGDVDVILRRANEMKWAVKFFGSNHTLDAFKRTKHKEVYNGLCFTYPLQQLRKNPEFTSKYSTKYSEPPQLFTDTTYDAVYILVEAIKESRESQIPLKLALENTSYNGLLGKYKFRSNKSLATGNTSLVCIKNNELVIDK